MQRLSRPQLLLLVALTLVWGINWPIMKMGVTGYPPLTFRTLSMWVGLPLLAGAMVVMRIPFHVPRAHWRELGWLTLTNMAVWHVCMILAVAQLSSGRAAILGYTMPIFSAVLGALVFGNRLPVRGWLGVGAAATGVLLLLWHELTSLSGRPQGVALGLVAAAFWALGTQQLRRTRIPAATLTLGFWMTAATTVLMTVLALLAEPQPPRLPPPATLGAIAYNGVGVFAFAQVAWLVLARGLPPLASTLSVMMIPVLGVFTGAWLLGEVLHWQDFTAVGLMMVAIASVLWPARAG